MAEATGRSSRLVCDLSHANYCRGTLTDEADDSGYAFANQRRRSNSSTQALNDFKTKFEAVDQEPVFEEELHGPTEDDLEQASTLSKEDSNSSSYSGSVDLDEGVKRM